MKFIQNVGIPVVAMAIASAVGGTSANAQEAVLNVGDRAPIFEAIADDGELWRSREHVGRGILVVYFYPAAMTAGCTTQACEFRDNRSVLVDLGAEVIGVSGDQLDAIRAFKGVNQLNFSLLSDTGGTIAEAFGVPTRAGGTITREVDGQEIELSRDLTMARWTFVIDAGGRISYKATDVDPAADPQNVIAHIRSLAGN
jgi:thioredoxin-dependent peroxiredoxin